MFIIKKKTVLFFYFGLKFVNFFAQLLCKVDVVGIFYTVNFFSDFYRIGKYPRFSLNFTVDWKDSQFNSSNFQILLYLVA